MRRARASHVAGPATLATRATDAQETGATVEALARSAQARSLEDVCRDDTCHVVAVDVEARGATADATDHEVAVDVPVRDRTTHDVPELDAARAWTVQATAVEDPERELTAHVVVRLVPVRVRTVHACPLPVASRSRTSQTAVP